MWSIALLVPLMWGCASQTTIARDMFVADRSCPSDQVTAVSRGADQVSIEVVGCGETAQYSCYRFTQPCGPESPGRCTGRDVCTERGRYLIGATDGSRQETWDGVDEDAAASKEAAFASAVHDLPCDRASVVVVAKDSGGRPSLLEGCQQRVTYQVVDDVSAARGRGQHVTRQKYVLVARVSISP